LEFIEEKVVPNETCFNVTNPNVIDPTTGEPKVIRWNQLNDSFIDWTTKKLGLKFCVGGNILYRAKNKNNIAYRIVLEDISYDHNNKS
jgi:hypothetical protein